MFNSYYTNILKQDFIAKYNYKNHLEIPKLDKMVLNFAVSQTSLKSLLPILAGLQLISSQKPCFLRSKTVNLQLRIRRGAPVGCKVDLRGKQMFVFLEKLCFFLLPQLKEFVGFDRKKKTFFLRIQNLFSFKELEKEYEHFSDLPALSLNIFFKTKTMSETYGLLTGLKFPTKEKK